MSTLKGSSRKISKKSAKTAEGKGKIETTNYNVPYDHTDWKNTKTYEITRMVFEDGNPEEVCEFCLGLKELFESAGITGNQLVTMTLSLLTGEARARFQNINREKTAKNADLDHRLNELELFNIVLDDWVETFCPQHTSNKSSSGYFAKQNIYLMYNCKMSCIMTVRKYYERMYRISTLMEFLPKRKNGTAPTPLTHEECKMAIEQGLSPAIHVEMFGMESTIDDTTESTLLPFLEVLKLKTQIKSATVEKCITTKQDQKCTAVFKKPPPPREHTKCKGHKDACGKLGHTWYECFNTSTQNTGTKSPARPAKLPKVSEIEPNEELKQMCKVAVDKPKYSDSDTEYFLLSSKNNTTLNKKLNRKCIPETVGEVLSKKDEIVPFKILLDSGTFATIIKNI
jgi:hypothetical protein